MSSKEAELLAYDLEVARIVVGLAATLPLQNKKEG